MKMSLLRWNHSHRKRETFSDTTRALMWVAFFQGDGSLLLGLDESRTLSDLSEQAAFHAVSRQPAQTSGVRKRLPFSMCMRSEVTAPLESHFDFDLHLSGLYDQTHHFSYLLRDTCTQTKGQ